MRTNPTALAARALLVALLCPPPSSIAGGIERNTFLSLDQPEVWTSVPPAGVPFSVVRYQDGNGQFYLPGFPYLGTAPPGLPAQKEAGIYNVLDAAAEWSLYDAVDFPYSNTSSFRFADPTVGPVFSAASSLSPLSAPPPGGMGSPTGVPLPPIPPRVFYPDGVNMVNMCEPGSSFSPFGGPFTLGLTLVYLNGTGSGTILETDIALQARTTGANGAPIYSYIGVHKADGNTYASNAATGAAHTPPSIGYVSLKGVLMHELGHAAGLAHSIIDVDSSPSGNESPTMNFIALLEGSYSATISVPKVAPGPVFGFSNVTINSSNTGVDGIYVPESETLSLDDRSALIEGYPGPGLVGSLGGFSGQVFQDPAVTGSLTPLRNAHVVAFDPNDPNRRRVGRITSGSTGAYTIAGLEPGSYAIMVEPIDVGGYLLGASLPSIASTGPIPTFFTELWGGPAGEATNEAGLHQAFATIQVFAGVTLSGVDLRVQARPAGTLDPLTVTTASQVGPLGVGSPSGSPPPVQPFVNRGPSAHGIQFPFGVINSFPTTATFTVDAGVANANGFGYMLGSLTSGRLDVGPDSSAAGSSYLQLYMLDPVAPTVTPIYLNGLGQTSVPFTIPTFLGLTSIYVQAMYTDATLGHFVMTNKVAVRSALP